MSVEKTPGIRKKLLAVQTELKAPKSQFNSYGKYHYRNVEDILEAVKPICAAQNALIYLSDSPYFLEGRFYIQTEAHFVDVDTGEEITVTGYAREDDVKKGMDGSQITGAASSYARKYALGGLLDVDDGKDADSGGQPKPETPSTKAIFCQHCKRELLPAKKKDGSIWQVSEMVAFGRKYYDAVLCEDCLRKAAEQRKKEK